MERPQTAPSHTWRRELQRFLPNFQLILPCASGKPQLGGGSRRPRQHSPSTRRGAPGASTFRVRGAASSQHLQGAGGGCYWVEVCATSLVRQSKSLEQLSAAPGHISSGQRKPPCEMGLALHSCSSIHAVLGEFLKMLSQPPPVMQNLAELFFLGGQGGHKTKDTRVPWGQCPGCCSVSTAAHSPWCYQRELSG